jgi:hypothetical protein
MGLIKLVSKFDPPMSVDDIKQKYPTKATVLLRDPIHRWRAESGIELIHKEPSINEQKRIWKNWQKMSKYQKEISDKKCKELSGYTNKELHFKIINKTNI